MAARIVAEDDLHRRLTRIQIAADSSDRVRNYGSETAFGPAFNTFTLQWC